MNVSKRILPLLLLFLSLAGYSQTFNIHDTFDDNRYNWWIGSSDGGSEQIHAGKMFLDVPESGWVISISPYVEFEKDFQAEASFRQTAGLTDNGVGLMWGYSLKGKEQNYFIVDANGRTSPSSTPATEKGSAPKGAREWIQSSAIKPLGQLNVLKVEQILGNLNFYINGEKVFSTSAFHWRGSSIGFVSYTKMTVEVDDYTFHQDGIVINLPPNLTKGFVKENLGPAINSPVDDLIPRISADGQFLYFGRENYEGNLGGKEDGEDFYVSVRSGTEWSPAQNMGSPVNTSGVDNICSISTDNNTVLFADGSKFWERSRTESGWADPLEIGATFVNEATHFEACLSGDGKAILFAGKNSNNLFYDKDEDERDVYVTVQDQNGKWSQPVNLGSTINTKQDEISPFLAADGRTLYYSTRGKPGYGNADIFMSKRVGDGWTKWTEPVNLGPEINSSAYDAYYVIPASGDYAYMVSDLDGYGQADIVRIKLPKELKPDPVVLVRGRTLDAKTKRPISADILIGNLATNKEVGEAISDPKTGDYRMVLPYGTNYGFHAAAAGYLSISENLELVTMSKYTEIEKDLYLLPIIVGQSIQLNNVFFEQAKPILKPESYPELDRLVAIMQENPTMEIELNGYTDNIGRSVSLIVLSQDRVGTVKKYMMAKGIASRRITGKGYGPANPVANNDTEEHRKMNRRVEFKITKK